MGIVSCKYIHIYVYVHSIYICKSWQEAIPSSITGRGYTSFMRAVKTDI
jgi:hypothetical protein